MSSGKHVAWQSRCRPSPAASKSGSPMPWQLRLDPADQLPLKSPVLDEGVHVPGKSSQCSLVVTLAWCEGLPRIGVDHTCDGVPAA